MAYTHLPFKALHMLLAENIAYQAFAFALTETSPGARHNTGGILSTVLQYRQGIIDIGSGVAIRNQTNQTTHTVVTSIISSSD
jgi:hypothetical protein